MIDERWDEMSQELGVGLREVLRKTCTPEVVREAEADLDAPAVQRLLADLQDFGLDDLPCEPSLLAIAAHELGRALAPHPFTATAPVAAQLGLASVALSSRGFVPAAAEGAVVVTEAGAALAAVGEPFRASSGEWLRPVASDTGSADAVAAERAVRLGALLDASRTVGATERLLEDVVDYVSTREQFGRPVGSFQAVAHKLADCAIAVDGLRLLVRKAAWTAAEEQGGDGAPPPTLALALISASVPRALAVAATAHQAMGGHGFTVEADCQLYTRRLRAWALGSRTSATKARQDLARNVLSGEAQHMWGARSGLPLPRWAHELDSMTPNDLKGKP